MGRNAIDFGPWEATSDGGWTQVARVPIDARLPHLPKAGELWTGPVCPPAVLRSLDWPAAASVGEAPQKQMESERKKLAELYNERLNAEVFCFLSEARGNLKAAASIRIPKRLSSHHDFYQIIEKIH